MTSPWLTIARDILAPLPHAGAPAPSTPEPPDAPPKPALMDSQAGGDSCGLAEPPLKDRPSGSPFTLQERPPMPRTLTTTTTVELEVTLEGDLTRGYPDSRDDPGMPDEVNNVRVLKVTTSVPYWDHGDGTTVLKYREIDLTYSVFGELDNLLLAIPDAEALLQQEVEE